MLPASVASTLRLCKLSSSATCGEVLCELFLDLTISVPISTSTSGDAPESIFPWRSSLASAKKRGLPSFGAFGGYCSDEGAATFFVLFLFAAAPALVGLDDPAFLLPLSAFDDEPGVLVLGLLVLGLLVLDLLAFDLLAFGLPDAGTLATRVLLSSFLETEGEVPASPEGASSFISNIFNKALLQSKR